MSQPWISQNWCVSQLNFWNEVTRGFQLPDKVMFHDATLRDGEQTPGVVFSREDKVRIARQLDKLGVHRIEAGMPAVTSEDFQAVKDIVNLGLKNSKVFCFSRAMAADIDMAVECGVWGVVIEIACGEMRLKHQFPTWKPEDVIRRSVEAIKYAKKNGLFVTFFPFDTTRANPHFLRELLQEVSEKAKPDSVAVVDTTGTIIPVAMKLLIRKVKEFTGGMPVEVHTHNDLGLGVANTLAALEVGAEVLHGCINGLGERCGNAALEEIIVAVSALYGVESGIATEYIKETCDLVEELSGVRMSFNKALAGQAAYMKESGIGIEVAQQVPLITFPIASEYVGATRKLVLGKKSGKGSIKIKLQEMGLDVPDGMQEELLSVVKSSSTELRRYLSDDEFREIVERVLEDRGVS
ncbi:MAG: LeuA family protein [Desulfocucumaceae bacterium]